MFLSWVIPVFHIFIYVSTFLWCFPSSTFLRCLEFSTFLRCIQFSTYLWCFHFSTHLWCLMRPPASQGFVRSLVGSSILFQQYIATFTVLDCGPKACPVIPTGSQLVEILPIFLRLSRRLHTTFFSAAIYMLPLSSFSKNFFVSCNCAFWLFPMVLSGFFPVSKHSILCLQSNIHSLREYPG